MAESISVDLTATDRASSKFRDVGRAAADTAVKVDLAAASLQLWDDTALKSKKSTDTLVASKLAAAKAAATLAKAEGFVSAEAAKAEKTQVSLGRAIMGVDDTAKKAASGGISSLVGNGGLAGGGMGALIGAGVVLSPVIATIGTGLLGLGAAAYGVYKPISTAAQATGGLAKNLSTLGPEQQTVALSLLALQRQYGAFEKSLQPVVLGDFNAGLKLAGHLMGDVQPVAKATGLAIGSLLSQVDAEFQSRTWQDFFGFMARTAGPDVQLLGQSFTNLLGTLPPLLRLLQPTATDLLAITAATTKLVQGTATAGAALTQTGQHMNGLEKITAGLRTVLFSPGAGLYAALKDVGLISSGPTPKGLDATGTAAQSAARELQAMTTWTKNLMTAEQTALSNQTAYGSALVTAANDAAALEKALDGTHGKIGLTTAAQRASFAAANTYITDLGNTATAAYKSGHGVDAAITAISKGLPVLDSAKTKNRQYWQEVQTLVGWLDKLRLEKAIHETVFVSGNGTFTVRPGTKLGLPGGTAGGPFGAQGAYVTQGTTPTADNVLAHVSKGELIVPAKMVSSGAVDHLRGSIPGFAAGGLVGSYSGPVAGLPPWGTHNLNAAVGIFERATASATLTAMKAAAQAAAKGFAGGGGAVSGGSVEALARRMFPWPGYMWPDFTLVENREAGWNIHARNPSSGAYGLAQFINGPSEYYQWGGNPNTAAGQLIGMFNYIRSRYGNPLQAWGHELNYGWYDKGGLLKPGVSLAVNNTGRPEMVVPPGGSSAQKIVLEFAPGADGALTAALMQVLRHQVRVKGGGNVQVALGRP